MILHLSWGCIVLDLVGSGLRVGQAWARQSAYYEEAGSKEEELFLFIATLDPNRPNKGESSKGCCTRHLYDKSLEFLSIWYSWLGIGYRKYLQLLQALHISPRFRNGERFLKVGDGRVPLLALRVVEPGPESCRIILSDCPSFMLYIISDGEPKC